MINSPQKIPGASSIDSPAATTNGDNYVLAWTAPDENIWWTTCPASNSQKSYDWVKPASIPNSASSGGPASVNFAGKAWIAWKGKKNDPRIFISSLSGSTWSPGVPISGVGSSSSPALTVTASGLYLAWKGEHDNAIYWSKSSDGKAWSPQKTVPGAASSDAPALAGFKGVVYLALKGESDNKMWFSEYTDAKGWETAKPVFRDYGTSRGPTLGVGDADKLHLVWKGESDNFVWESVLETDPTSKTDHWGPPAKIVAIETNGRPALASQISSATDLLLVWKGGATNDLWAAPLDNLHKLYPVLPGSSAGPEITYCLPVGATVPANVSGPQHYFQFGSGPNKANVAMSLQMSVDGKARFSGWYQDLGSLPIITAPAQNYSAVVVVMAANKMAFTFSHSGNDIPTGGGVDKWDNIQTNESIAKNWTSLAPAPKSGSGPVPQTRTHVSCTNTMDLGAFLDEIIQDLKKLFGYVEDVVEVVSVIASVA